MKKIAIIVTTHWSSDIRPYGQEILTRLIDSLHCIKYPYTLYIVDNQSQFKLSIPDNVKYIRIDDQFKKGLTGAWNVGLYSAYCDDNDILINCNDDLYFNETINNFIEYLINGHDDIVYTARTNGVLSGKQLSTGPGMGITELSMKTDNDIVNGFFFGFTKNHYTKYAYMPDEYFPIEHIHNGGDGKWGGQEGYWMTDNCTNIKGQIINSTFIPHTKYRSWKTAKGLDI